MQGLMEFQVPQIHAAQAASSDALLWRGSWTSWREMTDSVPYVVLVQMAEKEAGNLEAFPWKICVRP